MERLLGLTRSLFVSAIVTLLALSLESLFPESGLVLLQTSALFMAGAVIWTSLLDGISKRGRLGFIHILASITAISWAMFAFTTSPDAHLAGFGASINTLLQNLFGLLILIWVVERCIHALRVSAPFNWVVDLAESVGRLPHWMTAGLLVLYVIMMLYRISLGLIVSGTGGVMTDVGTVGSIVLQLSEVVGGVVTVLGWLLVLGTDRRQRTLGWLIILAQGGLSFFGGRRVLLGLFLLGGLIWVGLRGITMRRVLLALLVGGLLVGLAGPLFQLMRHQALNHGVAQVQADARISILRESFGNVVKDFSIEHALSPEYMENVEHRSGFLEWTVALQERIADGWDVRWGEIFFQSAIEFIPQFLWPGKLDFLGDTRTEQKIQQWFHMPVEDGASTTLAYAIADGGWFGVLIYFAGFGLLLGLLLRFMVTARFALSRLWAAATVFGLCFGIESGVGVLFGAARFLGVIIILERLIVAGRGKRRYLTGHAPVVGVSDSRLDRGGA